ncbi:hypothetical protein UlMin_019811 [Ulmus minor]
MQRLWIHLTLYVPILQRFNIRERAGIVHTNMRWYPSTTMGFKTVVKKKQKLYAFTTRIWDIDGTTISHYKKSMIELSRTQDEEVGDGTTSVIVLAGEMLHVVEAFIDKSYHPIVIYRALEDVVDVLDKIAMAIDIKDRATMLGLVKSCIGTKFTSQFGDLMADLAIDATTTVGVDLGQGLWEVDIKKYIMVEKIPGVMFNKDVVAPGKMRRKIVNPRIILLESPLEYKKNMEEEYIENLCAYILKFKPDLVIIEKGLSDLACHYLSKAGASAIKRLRKTDKNRITNACGVVIVNRVDELQESNVGTGAEPFEVKEIGDEFFAFIIDRKYPKAYMVLLRGASKDLLNEVKRNLHLIFIVGCLVYSMEHNKNPKLVPGGGGAELIVSATLKQKSSSIEGIEKWSYGGFYLAQNCGVNVIRTMTTLQGKHANGENAWIEIDGNIGAIADMKEQKTSIEATCMLLRIDDIVSGIKKKQPPGASTPSKPQVETKADADNDKKNVYSREYQNEYSGEFLRRMCLFLGIIFVVDILVCEAHVDGQMFNEIIFPPCCKEFF